MGPLQGIRVIDLTAVVMGPSASQALGDMGAAIIKVESPEGDITRQIGPSRNPGMGAMYLNTNRNNTDYWVSRFRYFAHRDPLSVSHLFVFTHNWQQ